MYKRGRPVKIDKNKVMELLLNHKNEIVLDGDKMKSKHERIWRTLSEEMNNIITPTALYTFVVCNKHNVRSELMGHFPSTDPDVSMIEDKENNTSTEKSYVNNSVATSNGSYESIMQSREETIFTINIPKSDFEAMLIHKKYQRKDKRKGRMMRDYTILQSGVWQDIFCEKIWEATKLSCGFNFKNHKLTCNGQLGYANGACRCGSTINCKIDNTDKNELSTIITCRFTAGDGRCGKRYLRRPKRETIVKNMRGKSAMAYRIQLAEQYMDIDDVTEPPHLYSAEVLRNAKYEMIQKNYIDKDPIKALHIMQFDKLAGVIHSIGIHPFYVHYWANYQLDVYRGYAASQPACIFIDATGSIVKKIRKPNNSNSKHIFLYNAVINCDRSGLFPVTQMLTESHTTNSIQFWLIEWIRTGAPHPREVVCDFSIALLTAAVRSFTGYLTLAHYADACKDARVPQCYVRIDVAHFIKTYANFLKDERPRIKQFYLSLLGQLILSRNEETAKIILTSILIIARSETEGVSLEDGTTTICEEYKIKVKSLVSSTIEEDLGETTKESRDIVAEEEEDNNIHINKWTEWAKAIERDVADKINIVDGDRENAHYLPRFADKIMTHIKFLPMWSCVCRDKFGYGRVPASSASVEGDFNIVKNIFLKNEETPMRVDEFVVKHVNFLSGRTKLVNAQSKHIENNTIEESHAEICSTNSSQSSAADSCPVCANGDTPTGAHKCYICNKAVHAINECSAPVNEEGYGQARICRNCNNNNIAKDVLPTREIENWRGLATTKEKMTSKYLHAESVNNLFSSDKVAKMPIIKNGSNISIKAIKIGSNKFSYTNTCAFDSLLQLFIAAYFEKEEIKKFVSQESNTFFKLVLDAVTRGITRQSYKLRAQILNEIEIFTRKLLPSNIILIDCIVNVGSLANKLFAKCPPFKEISKCSNGCVERKKEFPLMHADINLLTRQDFKSLENKIIIKGARHCCRINCNGLEETMFSHSGPYVMLETYACEGVPEIKLRDIPKKIEFIFLEKEYHLIGIVNYTGHRKQTRHSTIGHYTAICYRSNNKWIKYDDCKDVEETLNENYVVSPQIVLYAI